MRMPSTPCKLLLSIGLMVLVAGGCKEQPEPPAPQGPAVVRKKIEAPEPPTVQAVTPPDQEVARPLTAEKAPEAEVPKKPAAVEPLFEQEPTTPEELEKEKKVAYSYDPEGKINPFQPVFVTQTAQEAIRAGKKIQERKLLLTPLQKIDVSQLKVVGIIISPTGNKALVEDPSGKGYVITRGTYIGANYGQVKKILEDRIIVEEEVEDFFSGKMKLQEIELRLQKEFGEV